MAFRLILCTKIPGKKVLNAETALSGVDFYTTATECLRKTIPDNITMNHQTFGALDKYIITLPAQIAFESGKFESNNDAYLIVPEDYLAQYIFYIACETSASRRTYPFNYGNSVTITSRIDEIAAIQAWVDAGYPEEIIDANSDASDISNIPIVDSTSDIDCSKLYPNCTVLDRIEDADTTNIDGTTRYNYSDTTNPTKISTVATSVMNAAKNSYRGC